MPLRPRIILVDPAHFDVSYVINPWMRPSAWAENSALHRRQARASFGSLCACLLACGADIDVIDGEAGLPDLVFPANAAVVLDGRAMVAWFACPERQGEEAVFQRAFERYLADGVLRDLTIFPEGCFQEGAGDAIWDAGRQFFWAGYGQRSCLAAANELRRFFDRQVVPVELATAQFYHLDTCFCPLAGGEVLHYPPAFTPASLAAIHAHVPPALRLEASAADAAAFCVNAVNIGRDVIMARAPDHMRALLTERGYVLHDVDLDPFILSGGGAYCMTLRLDRGREAVPF